MYNPAIKPFNHSLLINKSGLCKVYYAPKDKVLSMLSIQHLFGLSDSTAQLLSRSSIQFKEDGNWLDFANDFNLLGSYSYDDKVSPQGDYTEYKVTVPVPHDIYEANAGGFSAMKNRQFVVFIILKDGSCRLLGSFERACDFDRKFTAGNHKTASKNDLTFSWTSATNALYFKNPFVDELHLEHTLLDYDCGNTTVFDVIVNNFTMSFDLTVQYFDEATNAWVDIQDFTITSGGLQSLIVQPFVFEPYRIYHTRAIAKVSRIISNTLSQNPTLYC